MPGVERLATTHPYQKNQQASMRHSAATDMQYMLQIVAIELLRCFAVQACNQGDESFETLSWAGHNISDLEHERG